MPGETAGTGPGFRPPTSSVRGTVGSMKRPKKLEPAVVNAWLKAHPGWKRSGEAIAKGFKFPDFAAALAFVVRVGCAAEKRDHHPDMELGWGRVRLTWSTHDAGGITQLDLDLAEASDGAGR